jgi:class 3 adenylate cyclase
MLLVAATLCLAIAVFVSASAEERRVRVWFFLLGLSCASVCAGLWVETNIEPWCFFAARVNMTAALAAAMAGFVSAAVTCRIPVSRPMLGVLGGAALLNVATVWITDLYFSGAIYRYGWGIYVGANPRLLLNPLLTSVIVLAALGLLARHIRAAHPLDRNRAKYLFAAYVFLAAGVLDYLPHFGIDLFQGSVCALTMPAFALLFGYASLRYRLVAFRDAVGSAAGWLVTAALLAGGYALVLELNHRFVHLATDASHVGAAVATVLLFAALGLRLPRWLRRALRHDPRDLTDAVGRATTELLATFDEGRLRARIVELCDEIFEAASAVLLDVSALAEEPALPPLLRDRPYVEPEVLRRSGQASAILDPYEIVVPLLAADALLGAVALGRRRDRAMYSAAALGSARTLGNFFAIAMANARRSVEIHSRRQLDRYLAPQVVESVLAGREDAVAEKRRVVVTLFFSDLAGFTEVAERLSPENLATVLNEYLSDMADIAFRHGGTLDKFIGDAVMVFFGAPVPAQPEEQARRCVEMAIDMQRRLKELNAAWRERGLLDADFSARIGIHTGEATVGSFGSGNRVEYTAIGRAVNLASRLEGKDTPSLILVSADTWALLGAAFPGRPRGEVSVKGFAKPVTVYEIDPFAAIPRGRRSARSLPPTDEIG